MPELVYIIAWFLLPLIPAFLLFKFLPSTGSVNTPGKKKNGKRPEADQEENIVKGPLNGLAIKFGGAFAGYLILFLLAKSVLNDRMKKPEEQKDLTEIWTIKGTIASEDDNYNREVEKPEIVIDPQPLKQRFTPGTFEVKIVAEDDGKGYMNFPNLDLTTITYKPESFPDLDFTKPAYNIDTSCYQIVNKRSRIITLKKPLVLHIKASSRPSLPGEELLVDTSRIQ